MKEYGRPLHLGMDDSYCRVDLDDAVSVYGWYAPRGRHDDTDFETDFLVFWDSHGEFCGCELQPSTLDTPWDELVLEKIRAWYMLQEQELYPEYGEVFESQYLRKFI